MNLFEIFFKQKNKKDKEILAINYALDAEVKISNHEYRKALVLLNKAIKNNPENDSIFYQCAFTYFLLKNYKKAEDNINKAIKLNNKIYCYFLLKSDICCFLNKKNDEYDYLRQALTLMNNADLFYKYKLNILHENDKQNLSSFYERKINMLSEIKMQSKN